MADPLLKYSFTSATSGASAQLFGPFSVTISGTFVGTVILEASDDDGASFVIVGRDTAGNGASWTAPVSRLPFEEGEEGILYRFRCSAYTSGTITARIGLSTVLSPGVR